jgi:hypothetical protein
MNNPHIHWLQMARAIWGERYKFNIFQSSGVSWVCNTLVNEQQDFSLVCPCLAIHLQKKLIKSC